MRRPLPAEYGNAPHLYPWLHVFYMAFDDLIADRHWPEGAIPWTARQEWAEANGLDELATQLLHVHVKAMDLAFLRLKRDTASKNTGGDGGGQRDGLFSGLRAKYGASLRRRNQKGDGAAA